MATLKNLSTQHIQELHIHAPMGDKDFYTISLTTRQEKQACLSKEEITLLVQALIKEKPLALKNSRENPMTIPVTPSEAPDISGILRKHFD